MRREKIRFLVRKYPLSSQWIIRDFIVYPMKMTGGWYVTSSLLSLQYHRLVSWKPKPPFPETVKYFSSKHVNNIKCCLRALRKRCNYATPIPFNFQFGVCMYFSEPYDQSPILVSSLNVVRGLSTPMDLVRVETEKQVSLVSSHFWSFLKRVVPQLVVSDFD